MTGDRGIATRLRRHWFWVPVVLVVGWIALSWPGWQREAAQAAGLGARFACSCRYVEGRALGSCREDLAGTEWMALVRYADDRQARRITASVPMLASRSARLKDGFGCLPEG